MASISFDEFVKRQQTASSDGSAVDWAKQRDEWLAFLIDLYSKIESFLRSYLSSGQVKREYHDIKLNEDYIGSYTAKRMVLKFGRQEVNFTPVGTLLIGSKGRVNVVGPAGSARLVLINKNATSAHSLIRVTARIVGQPAPLPPPEPTEPIEWVWKIVSPPPTMKFINLTQESFYEMILEVVNA